MVFTEKFMYTNTWGFGIEWSIVEFFIFWNLNLMHVYADIYAFD